MVPFFILGVLLVLIFLVVFLYVSQRILKQKKEAMNQCIEQNLLQTQDVLWKQQSDKESAAFANKSDKKKNVNIINLLPVSRLQNEMMIINSPPRDFNNNINVNGTQFNSELQNSKLQCINLDNQEISNIDFICDKKQINLAVGGEDFSQNIKQCCKTSIDPVQTPFEKEELKPDHIRKRESVYEGIGRCLIIKFFVSRNAKNHHPVVYFVWLIRKLISKRLRNLHLEGTSNQTITGNSVLLSHLLIFQLFASTVLTIDINATQNYDIYYASFLLTTFIVVISGIVSFLWEKQTIRFQKVFIEIPTRQIPDDIQSQLQYEYVLKCRENIDLENKDGRESNYNSSPSKSSTKIFDQEDMLRQSLIDSLKVDDEQNLEKSLFAFTLANSLLVFITIFQFSVLRQDQLLSDIFLSFAFTFIYDVVVRLVLFVIIKSLLQTMFLKSAIRNHKQQKYSNTIAQINSFYEYESQVRREIQNTRDLRDQSPSQQNRSPEKSGRSPMKMFSPLKSNKSRSPKQSPEKQRRFDVGSIIIIGDDQMNFQCEKEIQKHGNENSLSIVNHDWDSELIQIQSGHPGVRNIQDSSIYQDNSKNEQFGQKNFNMNSYDGKRVGEVPKDSDELFHNRDEYQNNENSDRGIDEEDDDMQLEEQQEEQEEERHTRISGDDARDDDLKNSTIGDKKEELNQKTILSAQIVNERNNAGTSHRDEISARIKKGESNMLRMSQNKQNPTTSSIEVDQEILGRPQEAPLTQPVMQQQDSYPKTQLLQSGFIDNKKTVPFLKLPQRKSLLDQHQESQLNKTEMDKTDDSRQTQTGASQSTRNALQTGHGKQNTDSYRVTLEDQVKLYQNNAQVRSVCTSQNYEEDQKENIEDLDDSSVTKTQLRDQYHSPSQFESGNQIPKYNARYPEISDSPVISQPPLHNFIQENSNNKENNNNQQFANEKDPNTKYQPLNIHEFFDQISPIASKVYKPAQPNQIPQVNKNAAPNIPKSRSISEDQAGKLSKVKENTRNNEARQSLNQRKLEASKELARKESQSMHASRQETPNQYSGNRKVSQEIRQPKIPPGSSIEDDTLQNRGSKYQKLVSSQRREVMNNANRIIENNMNNSQQSQDETMKRNTEEIDDIFSKFNQIQLENFKKLDRSGENNLAMYQGSQQTSFDMGNKEEQRYKNVEQVNENEKDYDQDEKRRNYSQLQQKVLERQMQNSPYLQYLPNILQKEKAEINQIQNNQSNAQLSKPSSSQNQIKRSGPPVLDDKLKNILSTYGFEAVEQNRSSSRINIQSRKNSISIKDRQGSQQYETNPTLHNGCDKENKQDIYRQTEETIEAMKHNPQKETIKLNNFQKNFNKETDIPLAQSMNSSDIANIGGLKNRTNLIKNTSTIQDSEVYQASKMNDPNKRYQ